MTKKGAIFWLKMVVETLEVMDTIEDETFAAELDLEKANLLRLDRELDIVLRDAQKLLGRLEE